jgi:hypothetical protein
MELDIQHDRAAGVFSALVDGEHCELDYHLDGTTMTIAALLWPYDAVEVQAYRNAGGVGQVFW